MLLHSKTFIITQSYIIVALIILNIIHIIFENSFLMPIINGSAFFMFSFYPLCIWTKMCNYIELSILWIIIAILGCLVYDIIEVNRFVFISAFITDLIFFKLYNFLLMRMLNKRGNEVYKYFKDNPYAEEFKTSDGEVVINPALNLERYMKQNQTEEGEK